MYYLGYLVLHQITCRWNYYLHTRRRNHSLSEVKLDYPGSPPTHRVGLPLKLEWNVKYYTSSYWVGTSWFRTLGICESITSRKIITFLVFRSFSRYFAALNYFSTFLDFLRNLVKFVTFVQKVKNFQLVWNQLVLRRGMQASRNSNNIDGTTIMLYLTQSKI